MLCVQIRELYTNYGVSSVFLDECQSYPFIMAVDADELFRIEADGTPAYTPREILEGSVVLADTDTGYWDNKLCRSYPNPLLVKLARGLWDTCEEFTLYGNCFWSRGGSLARSGVLPHV